MSICRRTQRCALLGVLSLACCAGLLEARADWPTYQGNAAHTGYVAGHYNFTHAKLIWKAEASANALNGIAVGGSTVVVTNQARFNIDTSVTALNQSTGSLLWNHAFGTNNDTTSPPAYANNTFFVQSDGNTYVGGNYLNAFDASSGAIVFSTSYQAQWETYLNPTPYGTNIYTGGGYYGGMYSYNASTGNQNWFGTVPQYDGWTPAIDGTYAYAYTGSGDIVPIEGVFTMIKLSDGSTAAKVVDPVYSWNGYTMNSAVVLGPNHEAFTINGGRLVSWNTQLDSTHTPKIRWSLTSSFSGQPSLSKGHLYVVNNGALNVLAATTGKTVWTWTPPSGSLAGPLIVTDNLVFASTGTETYAISIGGRKAIWSYAVSGVMAFSDGSLYVAGSDGNVYAFAP